MALAVLQFRDSEADRQCDGVRCAKGRNRQEHLIDRVTQFKQFLGRLNWDSVDRTRPIGRVIVKEGDDLVIAGQAQSCRQLSTGLTCAVYGNTQLLVVLVGTQIEQYIPKGKAHRPCESGEQKPQQDPAAARRHRQPQHHTDGSKQQHKKSIAPGQAIERCTAHIAGKPLVLTRECIKR